MFVLLFIAYCRFLALALPKDLYKVQFSDDAGLIYIRFSWMSKSTLGRLTDALFLLYDAEYLGLCSARCQLIKDAHDAKSPSG